MARGPDGKGGGPGFSLADQLFNARSVGQLGREYSALPGFDGDAFAAQAVAGLSGRGLLERLDWLADCVAAQLPQEFDAMADALEAAMRPPLDPTLRDDDFGQFIHAVPGILAVRHGLEDHPDCALDLIHQATQRFSMEFYIRPFLNRWPDKTLERLRHWVEDDNYHVRRLVSEGTRPRLPWARNITLDPLVPLEFLDRLHADPTRYVTRSVANHLNDISKVAPNAVTGRLQDWSVQGRQDAAELGWMTRHALRTAVKRGEPGALALLGYGDASDLDVTLTMATAQVAVGERLEFDVTVAAKAQTQTQVLVDYRIQFARPGGRTGSKVFKLGKAGIKAGSEWVGRKSHLLKADATTFRWHPGMHRIVVQVNGQDRGEAEFEVLG
ncbi:hypothetical protein P775_08905 [Puniceibacterium antarcticum]|uniref:DNA alkylation repair protein n=1 Tax=Puniceibacterium antarcticum TaxID=1206336 RepID=A0A2G8RGC3_9RHOB|nr:hypothetical protein [Puniceibacterium antarcticum]PIL20635.1 hypothetical protein P775_08905 [Puniceibacterium antarcticum]